MIDAVERLLELLSGNQIQLRNRLLPGTNLVDPGTGGGQVLRLALSADNLAAGFALGAYHTGLAVAATVFGVVSVVMSLAGLELGAMLGAGASDRCELVASVMLIAIGFAVAAGVF